ncbi:MAG: hypothetical protein ACE5D6_01365 [Candidatus Zixiibacteriota bacterium]
MFCTFCSKKILINPVIIDREYFCSSECANLTTELDLIEENKYQEEDSMMEEFYENIEE